ncbi:MAG: hypothetical protein ABW252_24855 [Polyangiales bacterium]
MSLSHSLAARAVVFAAALLGACASNVPSSAVDDDEDPLAQTVVGGGGVRRNFDGGTTRQPDAGRGTVPPPVRPTEPPPEPKALFITASEPTYEGTLCSADSASFTEGTGSFDVSLAADGLDGNDPAKTTGACRTSVLLTVPAGYAATVPSLCAKIGLVTFEPNEASSAKVAVTVTVPGQEPRRVTRDVVKLPAETGDRQVCFSFADLWLPGCSNPAEAQATRVTVDLEVEAGPGKSVSVGGLMSESTYLAGSAYKTCQGGTKVLPAASSEGGPCLGPNEHGCASRLSCVASEVNATGFVGTCKRAADAVRARPAGELCGDTLGRCESGLECKTQRNDADVPPFGRCKPPTIAEGGACTGAGVCNDGLVCSEGRCAFPPPGGRNAVCSGGPVACEDGLSCAGSVCLPPAPREGEACGGDLGACADFMTCDAETSRCRPSRGARNDVCAPLAGRDYCEPGLTCRASRCRE